MMRTDFVRGLSDSRLRKKIRKKCNPIEHTLTELIQYAIKYGKENYDVGLDSESDEDDPSGVRRHSYSATARMFEDRFGLGPAKKNSDRKTSSSASTSRRSGQAPGGRNEDEISMKEVAAQLVTVVAPLTEFIQNLQRQRVAAVQRQQTAMAAGTPMARPAAAGVAQPLRCYNCNQSGHLAKDCPKPRTQSGPGGPTGPSQIPLAASTAAGQGRVATVMDTGTTEMVARAATEIGPDKYMAAAMFEPGTIGVIHHVQRITEESDLGPWRPGFEDLMAPGPEYKDGHIDVLDALKALDLRVPVPIPYLLTISEAANEKLIERCLKNRRRFEESRKGEKPVLRDLPTNEESQPSTSKVHEANRVGMIQTVDPASEKPEAYDVLLGIPWQAAVGARMHFDSFKVVLTSAHPKPQTIPMRLAVRMRTQPTPRITTKAHQINMIRRLSPGENETSSETDETDVPDRYPIRVQDWWRHSWRREPLEIVRSESDWLHAFSSVVQGEPLLRVSRITDLSEALASLYLRTDPLLERFTELRGLCDSTFRPPRPLLTNAKAALLLKEGVSFQPRTREYRWRPKELIQAFSVEPSAETELEDDSNMENEPISPADSQLIATVLSAKTDNSLFGASPEANAAVPMVTSTISLPEGNVDVRLPAHVPDDYKHLLLAVIRAYPEAVSIQDHDIGLTHLIQHAIDTGDSAPIHCRPYRYSLKERQLALERLCLPRQALTNLLKKEQLIWTPECEAVFRALKEALTSAPVLACPDPTRQFARHTDWQPQAILAVLTQQGTDGREHVIEYASKTLSQAQSNYEACEGECLAVVWGVQHFRLYLYGQKFVLVTDHQPLLSLRNNTDYMGTLGRWAVRLQDYDFDIRHCATRQHGNADGLTRLQPPNKSPANEKLIPWKLISPSTEPDYGEVNVLRKDRLLRHQFNEERQLRYDIQQVNVPAPGVADLAAYSLLCDRLTYAGVYVDVTQLPGREATRVFIEFHAREVTPNFVHSVATFIEDLTILPQPSRELARSFVREYAVQAARSVARVLGQGGHRFTAHEALADTLARVIAPTTRPKPAQKEGTVALYPFAQLQTTDPGLLELIHLELLSIAQVIASEEEEVQPRLRTAAAPRKTYNAVVIPDYIAQREERLEDFPEEKTLRPPSSYPKPTPPKAPKKTPKRKRRHPSPGAQGSRIGGGEEAVQLGRTRNLDPVPGSAATLVKETGVPSPPFPRVPDLNLDGAGPSAAAPGGGSRMGLPDPVSRSPVLAGPFRFRQPPRSAPVIDISSSSELEGPSDRDAVAAAKAQQEAAEAERQRLATEAAAQAQQNAEADAAARDQRNAASTESLIHSESLGPRVRRKTQPTQVTLADGCTQKSIDRCVDGVPVYFAPLACEPVSFDILDTKFDMILGMSWLRSADHPVNFHDRTVHIRDQNGVLVPCTVATPHTSIACHVVSVARIRDVIARNDVEEMGLVFLHALPSPDGPAASPPDPRISHLLDEYRDVFKAPTGTVPDRPIRHAITLKAGAVPPRGCIYRMSEEELEVLRAQLDDLLDKGWIRPSCSPYGAPVLFVRKKNKDLRLCIDYRKLNAQTVRNADPRPRIDNLLEWLGGATYFSKLDLKSCYHQIEIQPQDRYKTAFKTRYGHFEWFVMPFGLTNAPATFQAAMTTEFRDLLDRSVLIYLDDILVYSRTLDEHIVHLRVVLNRLRRAKYKANLDKCEFAKQELEYLGHFVTPKGIRPLADKIQAIVDWSEPRCTTDVRSFMGLAGYYQRFVEYERVLNGVVISMDVHSLNELVSKFRNNIEYVEVDGTARIAAVQLNPPWQLDRIDSLPGGERLDGKYTYNPFGGANVNIYVLDTGIRETHEDFYYIDRRRMPNGRFASRVRPGFNAIGDFQGTADCQGHGTHVAGTAAGLKSGVAKSALLYPVRALGCNGDGAYQWVLAGLDWIARNMVKPAIVTMSITTPASPSLDSAINTIVDEEGLIVGEAIESSSFQADDGYVTLSGTSMATPLVGGIIALYLSNPANSDARQADVKRAVLDGAIANGITTRRADTTRKLLNVNIKDPIVMLAPRTINANEGTTQRVTVQLLSMPNSTVIYSPQLLDTTVGYFAPRTLSFNIFNWNFPQRLMLVLPRRGGYFDKASIIHHYFMSNDPAFERIVPPFLTAGTLRIRTLYVHFAAMGAILNACSFVVTVLLSFWPAIDMPFVRGVWRACSMPPIVAIVALRMLS
ncbi:hypothetical protein CBR_g38846 [Chara braunii]|uniref:RNA-directed DNA polymerase n=1 Tax=Chara braunii TaxID=69332 RepID=A0A388LQG5_CHABU|nr:hypothetical protein CBR_g38846 [Chara braunii]|eukprot:GBG84564.1 hypothetical protein CBR_g38846 [Chara braunii]